MPRYSPTDSKLEALRRHGTVHRRSEEVADALFLESDFFDPRDLVQVKYEMLRRAAKDRAPAKQAAEAFGMSRMSFYEAKKRFEEGGICGLLPEQRGPKRGHKLTEEILDFAEEVLREDFSTTGADVAERIEEQFGVTVYRSSVKRALERREKKPQK